MASPSPAPQPGAPRRRTWHARDRYELQEQIGSGAMGTVFRALDRELNRTVAVKVLRPELVTDLQNLLRLKRELVLASRVSNEHVVRVHDIGEIEGRALISMDWVDGESLAQLLNRMHCLPPSQVMDFAVQICQALRAVHAAHVIHQDLKPGNLLIRRDGTLLTTDFGLARSALPQDSGVSRPGETGGTPRYMAPEVLAGLPADARSDLYSFGMVLLEMLTGTTALEALAPLRLRLLAIRDDKYRRSAELYHLAKMELVIRRCLHPDRSERYSSAEAVLNDLEPARPESSARCSRVEAVRTMLHSRKSRIALLAVALLLAAFGYAAWRRYTVAGALESERLYIKAMSLLGDQSGETELRNALAVLDQIVAHSSRHMAGFRARIDTLIRLYEQDHEPQWLRQARETVDSRAGAALSANERTLFRARIDLNAGSFQQVIRALESNVGLQNTSEDANRLLGRARAASGQLDLAVQCYLAAIRINPESWRAHNELGATLLSLGKLKDARKEFSTVIKLRPNSPVGYENLGTVLLDSGDFPGAAKSFEAALERALVPSAYYNLGVTAFFSRQYATSIPFYEAAIRIRPASDLYFAALADALRRLHRTEGARDNYAHALTLLDQLAKTRPLSVPEQCRRAICLARVGDLATAASALDALPPTNQKDIAYARAIVAMLEGRLIASNRHLREAVRFGYPSMLIEMNPDFDDVPP